MEKLLRRRSATTHQNPVGSPPPQWKHVEDEESSKKTNQNKYFLQLACLRDDKRTNNNRIGQSCRNPSKLALINYFIFIVLFFFLPLSMNDLIVKAEPTPVRISSYSKSSRYSDTHNYNDSNSTTKQSGSTTSRITTGYSNIDTNNNSDNANRTISSKNYSTHQVTSIARPFYTKITSDDAVAKPSNFVNSYRPTWTTTKKPKRSSNSTPPSTPTTSTTEKSSFSIANKTNSFFSSSDSGPKFRLEPFFNMLTSFQSLALGTSKEKHFSPSYQTITQSIDENTKKTRAKSTKGMREKKRNRKKNSDGNGPIPIPIPKPLIDPEDMASDSKNTIVHPLDVLSIPVMFGGSKEMEPLPTAESLKSLESITKPNHWPYKTTQRSGERSKLVGLDKYNKTGKDGPESRERRLRSDFFENFHDKDVELQADESVMEPQDDLVDQGLQYSQDKIQQQPRHPPSGPGGRNVNIPPGYTHPGDIQSTGSSQPGGLGQPPFYSTIYSSGNGNKEDIEMISKYPVSFSYNPVNNNNNGFPLPPPQRTQPHYPIPIPYPNSKQRPNLHSYYDPHYHKYAGLGENSGPHGPHYNNRYGNQPPGFNSYGSHYVGHTLTNSPPPSLPFPQRPDQDQHSSPSAPSTGESAVGTSSDLSQQGTSSDTSYNFENDNTVSNSNQKIGVMSSFDLFYKEYKLLTWAAFLVITSLALLSLLVFLYTNNPPTEVVQARRGFSIENLLSNQQILKFLSGLVENNTGSGRKKRKKYKTASLQQRDPGSLAGQILGAIKKDL